MVQIGPHDNQHNNVPGNPLRQSAPLNITFTVSFMQAVAANVAPGTSFQGITFESDCPGLAVEVPSGGHDIQDERLYWRLPGGRCVCKSVRGLAELPSEDLMEESTLECYEAAAAQLNFYFLGVGPDDEVNEFREAPGQGACRGPRVRPSCVSGGRPVVLDG